jgi:CRP-like cAMP-binding protein
MNELAKSIEMNFGLINPDDIQQVASFFTPKTLKKGDYFLQVNKRCEHLAFIESGYLRIFIQTEEKEVTQWISTAGYFVTDLSSFIHQKPARFNMQALSDVNMHVISKSNYDTLAKQFAKWNELEKQFIIHCFITLEERMLSHLSMTAEERYQFFFNYNKELFNQVPLQYIASMLGMTPETFSRIRKKQLEQTS